MKYRFFKNHLNGGNDPDAERIYRWHISERSGNRMRIGLATDAWKRTLDDYVDAARALAVGMMVVGFNRYYAVPIDPQGELLDGAHRVACACVLREEVFVSHQAKAVWAPAWDMDWFVAHGMADEDLARLYADWNEMRQ